SLLCLSSPPPPRSTPFPYTTLFRSTLAHKTLVEPGRGPEELLEMALDPADSVRRSAGRQALWVLARENVPQRPSLVLRVRAARRSEEHTSELQSRFDLVCRLLLEKK